MMYVPGNNPSMLVDAAIYGADSIMFDLEDSVSLNEKDSARMLVFHMVKNMCYEVEVVVRINGLDTNGGREDVVAMVTAGVDVIRLPKTDTAQDVLDVEKIILEIEEKLGREPGSTKMMAAIESPLGVINAYAIATSSERLIGIALGAEDYVTSMKTKRSETGIELMTARSQIVIAARAAGICALDTVYSDVENEAGFLREVNLIKALGFDGKSVINPRQIKPVHDAFYPKKNEIDEAKQIMFAIEEANQKGLGVLSLNGKMIDKPIVERAERTLELAGVLRGEMCD